MSLQLDRGDHEETPHRNILLSCLLLAPIQAAFAQADVAYSNESTPGYVIFFSNGPAHLSTVAVETIQMAAAEADRSDGLVRLVGPVGYATAVKDELVRGGVPARAIVVVPRTEVLCRPLAMALTSRQAWRSTTKLNGTSALSSGLFITPCGRVSPLFG